MINENYRKAKEFYGAFVNDPNIPKWFRSENPLRGGCDYTA